MLKHFVNLLLQPWLNKIKFILRTLVIMENEAFPDYGNYPLTRSNYAVTNMYDKLIDQNDVLVEFGLIRFYKCNSI